MKRHYVRTLSGWRCVSCRCEFSTKEEFGKHCGRNGTCRNPMALGMYINADIHPYHWTSTKPACYRREAA